MIALPPPLEKKSYTEYANRLNRGRLVGLTFLFYVFGQVAAYVIALVVVGLGSPPDLAWRVILGLGAIPSLLVLWNRRHMPESPRWTLVVAGDADKAAQDLSVFSGKAVQPATVDRSPATVTLLKALRSRSFQLTLLGTAGSWFFFNVAVYGNSVSQPLLISSIAPHTSIVKNMAINAALVVCFSLVAAFVGLALLDRIGRKSLQILGFSLSAMSMALIAAIPGLTTTVAPFAIVFGLSLFGIAVGPNYTTMLLAAECYPTAIRSTAHGISAGTAKVGAFLGALITPVALAHLGLRSTVLIAGVCFVLGICTTMLLAESNGTALDSLDAEPQPRRRSDPAGLGSQPVSA